MCLFLADCKVVIGGSEGSVKVLLARTFIELHSFRLIEPIHPMSTTTTTALLLPYQSTPSSSSSTFFKPDATSGSGPTSTTSLRRNSAAERLRRTLSSQRGASLAQVRLA